MTGHDSLADVSRWFGIALIASGALLSAVVGVAEPVDGRIWQQSVQPQVVLAVRSKNGGPDYEAKFVVVGADGKPRTATVAIAGDTFGQVSYPKDFATDWIPGRYRWKATVDGALVGTGVFLSLRTQGGASVQVRE